MLCVYEVKVKLLNDVKIESNMREEEKRAPRSTYTYVNIYAPKIHAQTMVVNKDVSQLCAVAVVCVMNHCCLTVLHMYKIARNTHRTIQAFVQKKTTE